MRVAVILRAIYDPASLRVSRGRGAIDTRKARHVLAPGDRRALEEALRLRSFGARVTALGLGPGAKPFLREAGALGADELVHFLGEGLPELDLGETPWCAGLAEGFARRGFPDLFLMGHDLDEQRPSQLGPRLAERLAWPLLTRALQLELLNSAQLRARCVEARWETPLPCLVTLEPGPRTLYPKLGALMVAGQVEIQEWVEEEIRPSQKGVEVIDSSAPPEERKGERRTGEPRRLAHALFRMLRRWGVLD